MRRFSLSIDKIHIVMLLPEARSAYHLANDFENCCSIWLSLDNWLIRSRQSAYVGMLKYKESFVLIEEGRKEGVVWIGLIRNEYRGEELGGKQIAIEWNPNKTELPRGLLMWLQKVGAKYSRIRSLDLALDFEGFCPEDCRIVTKRTTQTIGSTIYVDPSNKNGEVKIYDKTEERRSAGSPVDRQVTRVEIRMKPPKYFEGQRYALTSDIVYWQDICNRLGEVYVPTDLHRLLYDIEQDYCRNVRPVTLFMLRNLSLANQKRALSLMDPKSATFYRAILRSGDVDRISLDEYVLMEQVSDMSRNILSQLTNYPQEVRSWYDIKKENPEKEKHYYDVESIIARIHDKVRRSQSATFYAPWLQNESDSPRSSVSWDEGDS